MTFSNTNAASNVKRGVAASRQPSPLAPANRSRFTTGQPQHKARSSSGTSAGATRKPGIRTRGIDYDAVNTRTSLATTGTGAIFSVVCSTAGQDFAKVLVTATGHGTRHLRKYDRNRHCDIATIFGGDRRRIPNAFGAVSVLSRARLDPSPSAGRELRWLRRRPRTHQRAGRPPDRSRPAPPPPPGSTQSLMKHFAPRGAVRG